MKNSRCNRRNYMIDKKFQAGFILRFGILVFLGGLITITVLYLLAAQSTTVVIHNSRVVARTTADSILPFLLPTVIIVTLMIGAAAAVLAMLVSHKISGPLFRFKGVLEVLGGGDFSSEFNIRRRDQLHDVADIMNNMIRGTRQELHKLKNSTELLKEKLKGMPEEEFPPEKRQALKECKQLVEELNKRVYHFKT
ncbi:MAG: methyl-accepting chemotaxis protein [Candidatus Omnitrophica bacterium]|nr:methyl-accepting chemotaxis protein [Candidatus Omnitrophota bacterium]